MVCPVCGSDEAIILKNKLIKGKNKEIREFLLKCDECGSVYNERISQDNPKPFRLIISEHEDTHKIFIDLFPDEQLAVGDFLMSELGKVKITSLELAERDFKIAVDDILKIDKYIARVHVIKTEERKTTKGYAKAKVIKRVYAKPVKFNHFDYDLTKYIVQAKPLNKHKS